MRFVLVLVLALSIFLGAKGQSSYGTFNYDSVKGALPVYKIGRDVLSHYESLCQDSMSSVINSYLANSTGHACNLSPVRIQQSDVRWARFKFELTSVQENLKKSLSTANEIVEGIGRNEMDYYLGEYMRNNSVDLIMEDTLVLYCDGCKDYSRDLHEFICSQELQLELVK